MPVDVILGLQWGDEGKGKIVDYLAEKYDIVARFQGGPNAGHTLKLEGKTFVLHTVPSGIFRQQQLNLIGNGVVIDPITLAKELKKLDDAEVPYLDRLMVARKAHLILPTHRYIDAASEASKGKAKIGSTLKGIGPTYMDKTGRNGIRVGDIMKSDFKSRYDALKEKHMDFIRLYPEIEFDLENEEKKWFESLAQLRRLKQVDGEYFINKAIKSGKKILAEGAQGSMLDIDFGTYPFVTSSNTVTSGVCNGLGVAPSQIGEVIGITKAYCTRVGSGPFPTQQENEVGEYLQKEGHEFGATTGRPRRCGWIDLPQLNYTIMLNGVTQLVLTKIDVLNKLENIKAATHYHIDGKDTEEMPYDLCNVDVNPQYKSYDGWQIDLDQVDTYEKLPHQVHKYVSDLEARLDTPVSMISTGPEREKLILRNVEVAS